MSPQVSPVQEAEATQPKNQTTVTHEALEAISPLGKEIHQKVQLLPEDIAKIDHVEWRLDWKPVQTVSLYPKKS